jgi:pimeloyl-ACP methyl ester carboxylesterase
MSDNSMKEMDRNIIGDVFKHVKLEQEMPKLTTKRELESYRAPTLVIAGEKDIFFPGKKLKAAASEIIPHLTETKIYEMGHFPSGRHLIDINAEINEFLKEYY